MRRAALGVLAVVVALAGSVGLIALLQARDDPELRAPDSGPGVEAPPAASAELRRGNILLTHRASEDAAPLRRLAREVAGGDDPALVEAGQAVLVQHRADQAEPVVARSYRRRLVVADAGDDELRAFVEFWIGQAAVE
jgi:hypothetical protein